MPAVLGNEGGFVLGDVRAHGAFKFCSIEGRRRDERGEQLRPTGLASVRPDQCSEQIKTLVDVDRPMDEGVASLPLMQRAHIDSAPRVPYNYYMLRPVGLASDPDDIQDPEPTAESDTGGSRDPIHPINTPQLRPTELMPQREDNGLRALSVFSGGGGLDLGFDRAGYQHAASYEILTNAAATLTNARPDWEVHGGQDGDIAAVDWRSWRGEVDIVHGGPPCQPFSIAGRQAGADDLRDMWSALVDCLLAVRPRAFVAENVPALASEKFKGYVRRRILGPLRPHYHVETLLLRAEAFGVPQARRRMVLVGFARAADAARFAPPAATHLRGDAGTVENAGLRHCMGVREALGLPDIRYDTLSPTIRSGLTGPHHTTSILNSAAAARTFARLQVWPNGVAATRERARAFVPENRHFRLSVPDVAVLQGFPEDWPLAGAIYMQLGQLGNAVPPPMAYAVAAAVAAALG